MSRDYPYDTTYFQRLLNVLLPGGGGVMVLFEGYFDESGSFDEKPPVFCMSGYFIEAERAKAMDARWASVLEAHNLPYFHMVDCAHGAPPFDVIPKEERIEIVKELIDIIKTHTVEGFSVLARADLFESSERDPDVYTSCVSACVGALVSFLELSRLDASPVAYFFETGHANRGNAYNHVANKLRERTASLTFAPKERVRLLQAADLLAWQSAKYVKDGLLDARPPRKDFLRLMEHPHMLAFVSIKDGQREMGFEAWPLSRRSPVTVAMEARDGGPIPHLVEEGSPLPIIPIERPIGWSMGGGRLAMVHLRSLFKTDFALAFDENRITETVLTLMGAGEVYGDKILTPTARKISIEHDEGGVIAQIEFNESIKWRFRINKDLAQQLGDALANLKSEKDA